MVESRRNVFMPNYAVPPGDTLKETIEAMGIGCTELAQEIGRPEMTINQILEGKATITSDIATQLERVLGVPASFWNNLEMNYQDNLARSGKKVIPLSSKSLTNKSFRLREEKKGR